jgi:outer membrane protein, adhesin transport system
VQTPWRCGALLSCMLALPVQALTLAQTIEKALQEDPAAGSVRLQVAAASADAERARAARWPVLGLSASAQGQSGDSHTVLSPQLQYTVFAGGAIEAGILQAEALQRQAGHRAQGALDELALQTAEAYLAWARAQDLVRLAQDNLQTHERIREDMRKIVDVDPGRLVDLNQAAVRVSNARLMLTQRETERARAWAQLGRYAVLQNLHQPAGLDEEPGPAPSGVDEALARASDSHPQLAQALAQWQAAQAAVAVARGQTLPQVDLQLSRQYSALTRRAEPQALLSLNMPVFNAGAGRAGIDAAQAQAQAARQALQEQRLQVRQRIGMAWAEWQGNRERERESQQQSDDGRSLVEAYRLQFRLARRSLLDLLNVQNEAFNYATSAVSARYDRRIARYRLGAALGELSARWAPGDAARRMHPTP